MTREELIRRTNDFLKKLPSKKLTEVYDYVEYLFSKNESKVLSEGMKNLSAESESLYFLKDEEELYTVSDVKEKYK